MGRKLSLDETDKYLKLWTESRDENALLQLVNRNGGLITHFVKKNLKDGLTFDDLFSAGKEGLIKAIKNYNYAEYGVKPFSTYISFYIEGYIKKEKKMFDKHSHVLSFEQPIGHNKDGDEMHIEDLVGTDADQLIEDVISEMKIDAVRESLQCLTSREQQIILLRYGLGEVYNKTQEEVAELFNCAQPTIARQEQKALVKMRHPRNTKKLKDFIDE